MWGIGGIVENIHELHTVSSVQIWLAPAPPPAALTKVLLPIELIIELCTPKS